jgi:kinesin family protein C2/C3
MDSRKSVRNLAESLHSLLGIKANLTSNWVKSVCDIIKTLPSEKSVDMQPTNSDINDDDNEDDDDCSAISKIKGKKKRSTFAFINLDAPLFLIIHIIIAHSLL